MTRPAEIAGPSAREVFGREDELSALLAALHEPPHGVITITGVPGVGKTRLVTEACARLAAAQGVSTAIVPLSALEDAASIPAAVAAVRQAVLAEEDDPRDVRVMVLDNTEHLAGAAEHVRALVRESPGTQVLATSISPLGVAGERVMRLGPLGGVPADPPGPDAAQAGPDAPSSQTDAASPDTDAASPGPDAAPAEAVDAGEDPAVQLFLQRASAAAVSFRPAEADTGTIAQLCTLLGGLPLAIELAAARVVTFPPDALLAQLQGATGLDLLREQHPGEGPDRHRTMREALEWSFRLLEPRLQQAAMALAVFAGSCTADAATAVADLPDGVEGLELLGALVDCHLLEPLGDGRFALLPLVRRFLADRLALAGAAEAVRQRHIDYVLGLGRRARTAYESGDHSTAFGLLESEWSEISAVSARLLDRGLADEGLELAVDAAPYLLYVAVDPVAQARMERFIELGRRETPGSPMLTRALLWSAVLTRLMPETGFDADWVRERLAEGMARARAAGDDDAVELGLEFIALSATVTGDLAAAEIAVDEGTERTRAREEGRLARFEALACMLAHHRGDLEAADRLGRSALGRALRRGDAKAILLAAIAILGLPDADMRALPPVGELVRLARDIRDRHSESFLLAIEASRLLVIGDDRGATAASAAHIALLVARGESDTVSLGFTVSVLVAVAAHRGEHVQAAELYGSIERLGDAVTLTSTPGKRQIYRAALDAVELALGPQRWTARRRHGAAHTPAQAAATALRYARTVLDAPEPPRESPAGMPRLSPRELDVLREVAAGSTNKQIAARFGLTPKTVMHYVSRLYEKLGVANRAAATAWAARSGLLDDPRD